MIQSGRRGQNARAGKERTDDPKWKKRKGMLWEEKKGWMARSGRGVRKSRSGKERTDDPKWERRNDCKRRKGNDG